MILVIAEHDNKNLSPSTRALVSAALKIGPMVHVLVVGEHCNTVADQAAKLEGIERVLVAQDMVYRHILPENMARLVKGVANVYSHVLAAASTTGKDYMPRVAALFDVGQVSEIIEVIEPDTFKRPIYAGNAIETLYTADPIKIITVRTTAFEKVPDMRRSVPIQAVLPAGETGLSLFISMQESKSDRPELTSARVVVSGGRGLGDGDKFKAVLEPLAAKLNAAIGASRAAVDAGYVPNDYQVGQTGKIVAPDLYIAVGISGAIQHLAGMKESKVIVAINKDENAPIFEIADYGLVGDLFELVPELVNAL